MEFNYQLGDQLKTQQNIIKTMKKEKEKRKRNTKK